MINFNGLGYNNLALSTDKVPYEDMKNKIIDQFFKSREQLIYNKSLPKLYLPENKIKTFIDWYNKDLRFVEEIPKAFEEGYFILENTIIKNSKDYLRDILKKEFKENKQKLNANFTWDIYKIRMDYLIEHSNPLILHFKFLKGYEVKIDVYLADGSLLLNSSYYYGPEGKEENNKEDYMEDDGHWIKAKCSHINKEINLDNWYKDKSTYADYISEIIRISAQLFGCTMWYLSTSTNITKYEYNQKISRNPNLERSLRDPKRIKTKSTPIYDMSKIRVIKVDGLIKRRKGWTYSHSFQVHGHYRHYKDGKVVFVKSYIKGKEKEFQQQDIIINPKN